MKKALEQNPNLLRTLLGLSFTLILLLAYAVYGATIAPSYYLYETDQSLEEFSSDSGERQYIEESNTTVWSFEFTADSQNLTWVNLSATSLSDDSIVRLSNGAGLYSHHLLGVPDAEDFSCTEQCQKNVTHEVISEDGGDVEIYALTSTDPARRNNGTVYAESIEQAEEKSRQEIEYEHLPSIIRIDIIEKGNKTTSPSILLTTVNEEFASVEVFSVDAATEFLWALAAVVGCFSMVLIPSFTVYFAARAKEKKDEVRLQQNEAEIQEALNSSNES